MIGYLELRSDSTDFLFFQRDTYLIEICDHHFYELRIRIDAIFLICSDLLMLIGKDRAYWNLLPPCVTYFINYSPIII